MSKKLEPDFGDASGPALHAASWRFGEFELDESKRELRRAGELLAIEPKPLNLLMLMLRHPGELITKNDLMDALWTGRIVTEAVLGTCVGKLRSVLGPEMAESVKNVHGFGYRFDAKIELLADRDAGIAAPRLTLQAGDSIPQRPNWQLVRRLGRSGDSWLAEHAKTRARRVFKFTSEPQGLSALKREVTIFRLLRESLGDKICYVELLDWNFDEPPYFVEAEYCTGGSLEEWFNAQGGVAKVPLATRLDLIAQIADALADVHIIGVLHKDLKPANIFVVPNEGDIPKIRLADFGSGRLLDSDRLAALEITRMGFTQVIDVNNDSTSGTPLYLAPEVLAGHPATVKADIYALGVILYQCVVGNLRRPLSAGWEQEVEDEMLREDIAIAAEGNVERRLANAAELSKSIRSIQTRRKTREAEREALAKQELEARAKDRRRARQVGLVAAGVALVTGSVVATVFGFRAVQSEKVAVREASRAKSVGEFLARGMFGKIDDDVRKVRDLTAKELVDHAVAELPKNFAGQDDVLADVHAALGNAYSTLEYPAEADGEMAQAQAIYERLYGKGSEPVLKLATKRITISYALGHLLPDLPAYRALAKAGSAEAAPDSQVLLAYKLEVARASLFIGDYPDTEHRVRDLLELIPSDQVDLRVAGEKLLGVSLYRLGKFREAEGVLENVLARQEAAAGPESRTAMSIRCLLGFTLIDRGDYSNARTHFEKARKIADSWVREAAGWSLNIRLGLAKIDLIEGREAQATAELETLVDISTKTSAGGYDQSADFRRALAEAYEQTGRFPDAENMLRSVLKQHSLNQTDDDPERTASHVSLARVLISQRKTTEAKAELLATPQVPYKFLPETHPLVARLRFVEGLLALSDENRESALAKLKEAENIYQGMEGSNRQLREVRKYLLLASS